MRDSVAVRAHAERVVALTRDAARRELDEVIERGRQYPAGSSSLRAALDYNAHLVTAVREAYERRGRKTCWAEA